MTEEERMNETPTGAVAVYSVLSFLLIVGLSLLLMCQCSASIPVPNHIDMQAMAKEAKKRAGGYKIVNGSDGEPYRVKVK